MDFRDPLLLGLLVAVPAVAALFAYAAARRREALLRFAGATSFPQAEAVARRRRWGAALVTAAVLLLALALAGPRYGTQLREVQQEGLDLIAALDVSESMLAEDVTPSRLERAKYEIRQLLEQVRGSRVGLVVFAGEAFLQCPLTSDFGAVRLFLDAAEPSLIPTQGTDFGAALRTASAAFDGAGASPEAEPRARALLIVSDGEDHSDGFRPALASAQEAGVTVLGVGVGTEAGGSIPVYRDGRLAGFKTDRQGRTVTTRLEERALRQAAPGGYVHLGGAGSVVPEIVEALGRLDRTPLATERFEAYAEQYQWPLALALLLLAAERLLAARRRTTPAAA